MIRPALLVAWRDQSFNPKPGLGLRLSNLPPHVERWRGEPSSPKLRRSLAPPRRGLQAPATLDLGSMKERRVGKKRNRRDLEPNLAYVEISGSGATTATACIRVSMKQNKTRIP